MTDLRTAAQQALEALMDDQYRMVEVAGGHYEYKTDLAIGALKAALAQEQAAQVPPEVAATLTTTDIAWLETRRLTKLWQELGQMRWAGADEGWDRAIEAVRSRLNDECQSVLDWKAAADRSNMTAIELLQKMPRKQGCSVCGIGADGNAYGFVCPRYDCPTKVTCGGTI